MGDKIDGISNWVGGAREIILVSKCIKSYNETIYEIYGNFGTEGIKIIDEKSTHKINVLVSDQKIVLVHLKLFALLESPEYLVIVGRLKK